MEVLARRLPAETGLFPVPAEVADKMRQGPRVELGGVEEAEDRRAEERRVV